MATFHSLDYVQQTHQLAPIPPINEGQQFADPNGPSSSSASSAHQLALIPSTRNRDYHLATGQQSVDPNAPSSSSASTVNPTKRARLEPALLLPPSSFALPPIGGIFDKHIELPQLSKGWFIEIYAH